jgi:aminoglycoside 6-adenylyltransferase
MMQRMADHDPVLDRVRSWAETQETVRAMVLTSTRAVDGGRVDELSDWDVILYVADPAPFAESAGWLAAAYGPVLVWWGDETQWRGFRHFMRLAVYRDGVKIDFTLAPADELPAIAMADRLPDALDVGYRVLMDRDGRTAALPPPTFTAHVLRPPTADEFRRLVDEFWFESTYVAKNLRRGELFPARYSLDSVMRQDLVRMLEWRAAAEHGGATAVGAYGRRLRTVLDEATWREVEATFAGAAVEDGWSALFAMLRLFGRIAGEVAGRLDLTYPTELDHTMTDYLRRVRAGGTEPARAEGQGG